MKGRGAAAAMCLLYGLTTVTGCVEWLEVADEAPSPAVADEGVVQDAVITAESHRPAWNDPGPLIPRSPGLRVPSGHWLRARAAGLDILVPYTWIAVEQGTSSNARSGAAHLVIRLQSHIGESSVLTPPWVRGVIQVAVPADSTQESIMGLSFGPEALEGSVLSMRLGGKTIQRVRVTSLELQPHGQRAIRGTIKGELTGRADEGQPVYLAFVAVDANGVQLPRQPEAP